jgi:hypothetical protein
MTSVDINLAIKTIIKELEFCIAQNKTERALGVYGALVRLVAVYPSVNDETIRKVFGILTELPSGYRMAEIIWKLATAEEREIIICARRCAAVTKKASRSAETALRNPPLFS